MKTTYTNSDLVEILYEGKCIVHQICKKDLRLLSEHLLNDYYKSKGDDIWYGCIVVNGGYVIRPSCFLTYIGETSYQDFKDAIEGAQSEVVIHAISDMFPAYKAKAIQAALENRDKFRECLNKEQD